MSLGIHTWTLGSLTSMPTAPQRHNCKQLSLVCSAVTPAPESLALSMGMGLEPVHRVLDPGMRNSSTDLGIHVGGFPIPSVPRRWECLHFRF